MSKNEKQKSESLAELVGRAKVGDPSAIGELFHRYYHFVVCTANRRLGDPSEAQDMAQEVFLRVIEKISQLREPEAFPGWLRTMTDRLSVNGLRRRIVERERCVQGWETEPGHDQSPDRSSIQHETYEQLHRGLQKLRGLDRETLESFYLHGRSLSQMSDEFDAPLGTIKRRLHVARKRLAQEMISEVAI
jgi:RNA polymerase sigma-70 factor (ECF subfamily)